MANKNNLTIYQRLSKTLNGADSEQTKFVVNRELIKDLDPQAYEREKLEAQQSLYLQGLWKKIDNELYQKAVFYEPTRIASYYDFEAMEFSLHGDTQIVTMDGFESIKDLADKGRDYEFITYAYDHNKKQVVPALARNAHYTRDEMTYKITFDDDTFIIATYGHRFLKRDGVYCKVEDLKVNDSMMPFYRKSFFNNQNYNWAYVNNSKVGHNGWVPEHTLVAEHLIRPLAEDELKISRPKIRRTINAHGYKDWKDLLQKNNIEVSSKYNYKSASGKNSSRYKAIPWDLLVETALTHKTAIETSRQLNVTWHKVMGDINRAGYNDWATFIDAYDTSKSTVQTSGVLVNHKIKSIEPHGIVPVYDLTVPRYKNFATDTIFSHNTPEIGAALDLYMEESCTANENGTVMQIYSESDRIKKILEELFFDVLDISSNLPPWTRNICKYGDNFVFLKVLPEKGVVGCKQLPNIEVTRVEPDFQKVTSLNDLNREQNVKFFWKNKDMEFNSFEVAHFRLLGDDRRLPYGTSMIDKCRRIWKQLVMSEDAMLTYRISRAAERRIYKIFVGNMDDKDIDAYIDKVANTFRRTPVVDSANGQVDLRYNMLSVDQDIFIPSRDASLPNPIDTLPGAQNLDAIADIKYIQNKLLTALRIPRPFIGFDEAAGDGKNLAMMDVRFARTIFRIQKALIQELNKIAIIHLYLKGFEDELSNFTLTLTNPSTQQDLLKIQRWREKVLLYRDAVAGQDGSFAAMSTTKAKKEILDMSDDEIKLDIQRQAVEKAAGEELKVLAETIKQTGIFKDIYDIYNIDPTNLMLPDGGEGTDDGGDFGGGGGGGMGGDLGMEPLEPDTGGDEAGGPEMGAEDLGEEPPEEPEMEDLKENFFRNGRSLAIEAKRVYKRVEKRKFLINEDINNMLHYLDDELPEKDLIE